MRYIHIHKLSMLRAEKKARQMKVRVHISSNLLSIDDNVFVDIEMPCTPTLGMVLFISSENQDKLEEMAKSSTETAQPYSEWFYLKSSGVWPIKQENLKDLSFADAIYVSAIYFRDCEDFLRIELDSDFKGLT